MHGSYLKTCSSIHESSPLQCLKISLLRMYTYIELNYHHIMYMEFVPLMKQPVFGHLIGDLSVTACLNCFRFLP